MQVIGASVDSPKANARWAEKHGLRMPLLCDTDRALVDAYGNRRETGSARRSTWLLDADGTVVKAWPEAKSKGHAAEVLEAARAVWG